MGIGFLELGFQPKWRLEDVPGVPKVIFTYINLLILNHEWDANTLTSSRYDITSCKIT